MKKELKFTFHNKLYRVDEHGRINGNGIGHFSDTWRFLGGSSHHWHNRVTVSLVKAFEKPEELNGCLVWDVDHGTTRRWGSLSRIRNAHIVTVTD